MAAGLAIRTFRACYGGGVPPTISWLEVESNDGLTTYHRLQNSLNKGLMPKILLTKDLAAGQDVKKQNSCALRYCYKFYL